MQSSLVQHCFMLLAVLSVLGSSGISAQPVPGPQFEQLDSNGDGVISEQEAQARRGLAQLLPHFDTNMDGGLDAAEFQTLIDDALKASQASRVKDENTTGEMEKTSEGNETLR